jgi:hypothetical protein
MECAYCGKPVDISANSGNYKKVEGWVKLRRRGANEVKFRYDLGEFMHRECVGFIRAGVSQGQGQLL